MTMIAVATYGDRAEFITDSVAYTSNFAHTQHHLKALTLDHLDAAMLTQGDTQFANASKFAALSISGAVATFDELAAGAAEWLGAVWEDCLSSAEHTKLSEPFVILVGWSTKSQMFEAYLYDSGQQFEQARLEDWFVFPGPWSHRPSDLERGRVQRFAEAQPDHKRQDCVDAVSDWCDAAARPRPECVEDWVHLAKDVRQQRSLTPWARVAVGGQVRHTQLRRGSLSTQVIHRYDDTGAEFAEMVAWTQHPLAQMRLCWCASGQPFRDCHLATHYVQTGATCGCGSGWQFEDCCRVADESALL